MTRTCFDDLDNDAEGVFSGQAPACISKCFYLLAAFRLIIFHATIQKIKLLIAYSPWCSSSQFLSRDIYCALLVSGPQCPLGTYVEQLSSGVPSCVTCPANSNSVETNSPECTCFNGYHRTNLEGPNIPCTCEWNNYYVSNFFTVDCISLPWPCMHY